MPETQPQPGGSVRPITVVGAAVLARPCREVTVFDDALRELVADMFATMYQAPGVGLAANQIGVDLRVFVIDCPDTELGRLVGHVVNPVYRIIDAQPSEGEEGCLSVPGPRAAFPRPAVAEVTGVDFTGAPVRMIGHGVAARCLQHETDHLDGHLYFERLTADERRRVLDEYEVGRIVRQASGLSGP